ncbi:ribonuclease [Luteimonas pelagia]
MRRHIRNPWVWLFAILALLAWLLWPRPVASPGPPMARPPPTQAIGAAEGARAPTARPASLPAFLPAEAAPVVARILSGAPHPHPQDGGTFHNRERRLPDRPRGHYREYTVPTPGLDHRGTRRIVTGGHPPVDWYYTDDHYRRFREFEVAE